MDVLDTVRLQYPNPMAVLPGRPVGKGLDAAPLNPNLQDEIVLAWEICNPATGCIICCKAGRYGKYDYNPSQEENFLLAKLQGIVGEDFEVRSRPLPDGKTVGFEAVLRFAMTVDIGPA